MPKTRPNSRSLEAEATAHSLSLFEGATVADAATSAEAQEPKLLRRAGQGRAQPVKKPRYLLEGETRLDTTTAQLVSQLSGLRWPRKWSAIRRYDLLAAAEIERLKKEWGDEPSPLLTRKTRDGVETVELSARGEEALVAREGERGFRRVVKGESGLTREYFIKRLTTSDGFIETRLSWFGAAWPLFEEASAKIESSFQAFLTQNSGPQRSLFEDLDAAERDRADSQLRLMESVRNGRLVLDYLMRTFGRDGTNPVRVAAWDLRALLGCENDPHGMRRVRGCLEALSEIRFEMHLKGGAQKARSFGALISEIQYSGGGSGDHGDGWFAIHLAPSALGCLAVFGAESQETLPRPRTIAPAALDNASEFDWQRSLSPAERERLKSGFTRSQMALAPHYDRAHGLSATQAELLRWIERQLTQERDASRFKHTVVTPGDRTPRLYSRIFCPALPQGRSFLGALGHFRDRPERGRRLASLAKEIGVIWPSPRAKISYRAAIEALLNDLRLIVEEVLDGTIVVCLPNISDQTRRRGENWDWRLLNETSEFAPEFLAAHGTFLCFISPDYSARLIEKLERYYQERFERGETPYLIKVRRADEIIEFDASVSKNQSSVLDTPEITDSERGVTKTQTSKMDTPQITSFNSTVSKTELSKTNTPQIIGVPETAFTPHGSQTTLNSRLKAARLRLGLTQKKLAQILGVSQVMISKWEKGISQIERETPSPTPISEEMTVKIEIWIKNNN